jgi:alpha,alpha-trehalase
VVDKPTSNTTRAVLANFNANLNDSDVTQGEVQTFVEQNFKGEGLELQAIPLPGYQDSPSFLNNISNPVVRAWTQRVHSYWTQLARDTNETSICNDGSCESTLIPLNHTFVVPGGRFREQCRWPFLSLVTRAQKLIRH